MLTGLLNLTRFKQGIAIPFQLTVNRKNVELAASLLELFQSSLSCKRGELEEEIKLFYVEKVNPKVVQGLAKILFNRCEFSDFGEIDHPALRERIFSAAARYWSSRPAGVLHLDQHKKQILNAAGIDSAAALAETDAWLYGDFSSNQVLKSFNTLTPEKLIHRFNIEQIQGLLLNAEYIDLKMKPEKESVFRQVMQMLKFFQLMFQVTEADSDWLTLRIDGPGSILDHSRTYGVEIANFFPAVLLLAGPWMLAATIKMTGRNRRFKLEITDQNQLQTFYQEKGIWKLEKVSALVDRFNQKYAEQYLASTENSLIALSQNRYLIPDLTIEEKAGKRRYQVEWLHYVSERKLSQLVQMKNELPSRYLFAVKGKKTAMAKLKKHLGQQLLVYTKDLTAPALLKAISGQR